MSSVREAIREHSRLVRMRMGQEVGEYTTIPSMEDVRALMVPLTEREMQKAVMAAASLEVDDNPAGLMARNHIAMQFDVFHSLREPEDPGKYVFASVDDMVDSLDSTDVDMLHERLTVLMDYSSPAIDKMTAKEFEQIKKAFSATDLNELTGRQWAAVKLCCQYLFPHLLRAKLVGTSSTASLTETSAEGEST